MDQETSGHSYDGRSLSFMRKAILYSTLLTYSALATTPFIFGCGKPAVYEGRVQGDIKDRNIGKKYTNVAFTIENVVQGANESGLKSGETITVNYPTSNIPQNVLDLLEKCSKPKYWVVGEIQKCKGESTFSGVAGKRADQYEGKSLAVLLYSEPKKPKETLESIKQRAVDIGSSVYERGQRALEEGKKQLEEIDEEYQLKETGEAVLKKGKRALEEGKEKLEKFKEEHEIDKRVEEAKEKAEELKYDAKGWLKDLLRKLRE